MKTGTKQAGTHEMTADAITGIGTFLRKTKIDELPQVWNILRGELSLVGPRPGLPVQTKLIEERQAFGVFSVLPGITGLAQINGVDMSDPERLVRLDAQYIAQRGLLLDLAIILATFLGRGQGDKVRAWQAAEEVSAAERFSLAQLSWFCTERLVAGSVTSRFLPPSDLRLRS